MYANVLKDNVKQYQLSRLQKRANTRTEEAGAKTKVQQDIAANASIEYYKATRYAEKARDEAENAKSLARHGHGFERKTGGKISHGQFKKCS